MIKLLAKLFIKDSKNYTDTGVRQQYGQLCGAFGIFLNIILFVVKFVFGTIAASVSMVADAFNNLSDAASSLVQILGFKLASKKPDPEHPFGHGRLEYISGLIISFLILYMGIELIRSSVGSLLHPETVQTNVFSIIILCGAILVKFYMYVYNHEVAKKIQSVAMEATAKDSLSDMISTFVVIISIIAGRFTTFPVDGIAGIIVGCFILKTGFESVHDTIMPLLGTAPEKDFVEQIEKEVMSHPPICGIHDMVVHDYGPGRLMVSLHAEVPGDMNIFDLHEVIDSVEVDITRKFNCHIVIHMDPVDVKNERLSELKTILNQELKTIHADLLSHDVRMVPGQENTNLIFDVVKPYDLKMEDEQLVAVIKEKMKARCEDVSCVVTVDVPFV